MDNAESPRGQPAKSGTTWQPRRSILVRSHGREREDKLGFEGEKREGKESRKGERQRIWVEGGERRAGLFERASPCYCEKNVQDAPGPGFNHSKT